MIIVLKPSDRLIVDIHGTDEEFVIDYSCKYASAITVESHANTKGRAGIIYQEQFLPFDVPLKERIS